MAENIQDKDLYDIAVKAAVHAHRAGMSTAEAHEHIYNEVLEANEGKPHAAAVAHGKKHFKKLKDGAMKEEALNEFDASDGISHTADPVAKNSKRKADKTDVNQPMPEFFTKVEAINQIMGHLSGLGRQELANVFKGLTDRGSLAGNPRGKALATRHTGTFKDGLEAQSLAQTRYSPTSVHAEDMDIIFGGEELSEEVREKALTIFEAAVNAKLYSEIARLEEEFEVALTEALEEKITQLSENIDRYLSYAVEQWVSENELAIESGLKAEVVEDFIHGLKNLFVENYVELPDDKIDLVSELSQHVAELEEKVNHVLKENFELKDYVDSLEVDKVFSEAVESLPLTQQEKLRSLVEGIEYSDVTEFTKKLNVIKETYFPAKGKPAPTTLTEELDYDTDDSTESENVSGPMSQYVQAISKTTKK
jgi:hypothetical protein